MKRVVVLAVHGAPAADFPRKEAAELFDLRAKLRHASEESRAALAARHDALDAKMRRWPRTEENDPFFYGSTLLAAHLRDELGWEVIVGFNEFCAPSVDEALDQAAKHDPDQVVVITPMMTPGGAHSKSDIPAAIEQAQARHPKVSFSYAWPFEAPEIAQFLAAQVRQFVSKK